MNTYSEFLIESGLSRINSAIETYTAGAVTAYRGEFTKSENQARNKKLLAVLLSKGYSVTSVKGSYIENFKDKDPKNHREVGEHSFFVVNRKVEGDDGGQLEKDLVALGRVFDQDSILTIPFGTRTGILVGTSKRENAFPSYGARETVGTAKFGKAAGEFFSRVKGRQFAFEEINLVEEVSVPDTINGKRVMKMYAEEIVREINLLT